MYPNYTSSAESRSEPLRERDTLGTHRVALAAAFGRLEIGKSEVSRRTPSRDGEPSNAYVWNQLIDREKARIDRNFSEADRIRDDLRDRGIEIYDRERRWEAKDGRVGQRPNHDDKKRDDD
ncbi:unnamed protein product [Symbiodinium natans]|uniref:Uncharacterized protein n=1 Tax=Symbiodinium natans TaxID=878477 RepID=A0A812PGI3_9DINO|nr:unnamed protein product [Symbiodinium natans]